MSGTSRAVRVDGLVNVRDLGGLRRESGGLTPTGVFFRSENVDHVTARGWEQLSELGVRTVVDLRQAGERAGDRTVRPDWLTTVAVDLDGLEHEWFWKDYWDNGLVGTALYYTPHLHALPQLAGAALAALANAQPGGVIFHCMGGRDRTGMIAMLLLAAASADRDEIVEDYMETVRLAQGRAGRHGLCRQRTRARSVLSEPRHQHRGRLPGRTERPRPRHILRAGRPHGRAAPRDHLLAWSDHHPSRCVVGEHRAWPPTRSPTRADQADQSNGAAARTVAIGALGGRRRSRVPVCAAALIDREALWLQVRLLRRSILAEPTKS